MRAVRVTAPGSIEVTDVAEPSIPGLALIRVQQVGICGTDVKILAGGIPVEYPRILGHEMIGEIVSAPPAFPYAEGTRVLVDPAVACGSCDICISGRRHLCRNGGLLGRDVDGTFTELIQSPADRILPVPAEIPTAAAGLLQVLGTCVHAVKRLHPFPGQVAAVIGLGVSGQLISQLLQLQGVEVVGVTRSEWKRSLASRLGAAAVAEPADASSVLDDITGGRGPELVVEAAGTEATLRNAIEIAGIGAEVLAFGTITGGGKGLPYYLLYHKELTIHSPRAAVVADYADGISLTADGKLRLEPLVTHQLDLAEAACAFEMVHDPGSLKVLMSV